MNPVKIPGMTKALAVLVNRSLEENGGNLPEALRSILVMTPVREAICSEWDAGADSAPEDFDELPCVRSNGTVTCSGHMWMGGNTWLPLL